MNLTIFRGVFFVIGSIVVCLGGYLFWKSLQTKKWPSVEGTITSGRVVRKMEHDDGESYYVFSAKVTYRYKVKGQEYKGDRISLATTEHEERSDAKAELALYPVGTTISVFYNPRKPSEAVLKPGAELWLGGLIVLFGLVFVGVGVFGGLFEKKGRKRDFG